MAVEKTFLTDRNGFNKLFGTSGMYRVAYGLNNNGYLKPFTTNTGIVGVPHYSSNLHSGFFGASSSGLNPFGNNTLQEGIVHGSGLPTDINTSINANDVRTYGFKNPTHAVGWGYDVFGYPAPNNNEYWNLSGVYTASGNPSTGYLASGTTPVFHGNAVPYSRWLAGPEDKRWDQHRGIWTAPQSVYSAKILRNVVSGVVDPTGFHFANDIRYDARILDGIASTLTVTGVLHSGPKPTGFKVLPYSSGDLCLIVHNEVSGRPSFSIFMVETPGTAECTSVGTNDEIIPPPPPPDSVIYGGPGEGNPSDSTGYLTGSGLFAGLNYYPLGVAYGGLGFDTIGENELVIGGTGNLLLKKPVLAGTGITLNITSSGVEVKFASGVSFNQAGINTNITELQGLSTPLSLSQGGTGASGKIFVDLGTNQNVTGIKQFGNQVRLASGTISVPALAFNATNNGFYFSSGINIAISGNNLIQVNSTGTKYNGRNLFVNSIDNFGPPITIQQDAGGSDILLEVSDLSGEVTTQIGVSGIYIGASGSRVLLRAPSGSYGFGGVELPSGGLIPNTAYIAEMFAWNEIPSGLVNGVNDTFSLRHTPMTTGTIMVFVDGLLKKYDTAYNVSGSGIYFEAGNLPSSGAWLCACYQYAVTTETIDFTP